MKTVTHWIGGKPYGDAAGASGTWGPVTDPATGAVTTRVAMAGADEVGAAVTAAKEAYATWRTSPLAQQSRSSSATANCWTRAATTWPR